MLIYFLFEVIFVPPTRFLVQVNNPYELGQGIIRLLENPALMNSMGQNGRQHFIDTFNYAEYIRHINNLFEEIISQPVTLDKNNNKNV